MKRFAVPLAVCLVLAIPATASADIRFEGKTGQRLPVILRTGDDGVLELFDVAWRASCRKPGWRYKHATTVRPPVDALTRDRFVDTDSYRERINDGFRAILNARVVANRVSERRWRGTFRMRVRVFKGSRPVTRCYKRTGWRVRRVD